MSTRTQHQYCETGITFYQLVSDSVRGGETCIKKITKRRIRHALPSGPDDYALRSRDGVRINQQLDMSDTITMANGALYAAGPAYSPKATCGSCHDYEAITKAYHFREGTGPKGEGVSDHWVDENKDGEPYKYLANAYAHLVSAGQFGAW